MYDSTHERQLLDAIEDAREELTAARRVHGAAVTVAVLGVLLIVACPVIGVASTLQHVDLGGLATGLLFIGAAALLVGGFWSSSTSTGPYKQKVRIAERAHRDYTLEG